MLAKNNKISSATVADLDAPPSRLSDMLVAEGDLYWHKRIVRIFAAAGIETRRIEREEHHPVWQAWLTRKNMNLGPDTQTASDQLRTVLREGGIPVKRKELSITSWSKDKLVTVFMFNFGTPGVLELRPAKPKKQGELWPAPI